LTSEKRLEGTSFGRCVGMQGKGQPAGIYLKLSFKSFNTPGNEIAPGSDVVRIDFEGRPMRVNILHR
jgi:hypothetical protein